MSAWNLRAEKIQVPTPALPASAKIQLAYTGFEVVSKLPRSSPSWLENSKACPGAAPPSAPATAVTSQGLRGRDDEGCGSSCFLDRWARSSWFWKTVRCGKG
jgi:hypothetical protein